MILHPRMYHALILALCVGAILVAYYFEYVLLYIPCVLCISQRLCFYGIIVTCIVALIIGQRFSRVAHGLYTVFALAGLGLAARQLWLQSLPADQVPACGPSLDHMFNTLPMSDTLLAMVKGTGNCAEVQWQFLHLSIAGWSAVLFSVVLVLTLWQIITKIPLH